MILSDQAILAAVAEGEITVWPFDRDRLGSNSYDVTLAPTIGMYGEVDDVFRTPAGVGVRVSRKVVLDVATENPFHAFDIPPGGIVLEPGELYLAVTNEWTRTSSRYVPMLNGKSSLGRLGVAVHVTAGFGDAGYAGRWTLEVTVVHPVRVYAGMPIAQIAWHTVDGAVQCPYGEKLGAKYTNPCDAAAVLVPSGMWKNFREA